MLVMMVITLFMKGHFRSNFVVCVYVTVNLYNQVICILPDFFS